MNEQARPFELPKYIQRYLAALSKLYGQEGNRELQEIIVNAQVRLHEEWSRDNWNGGTYGHALYLMIPETLFLRSVQHKVEFQNRINEDLNKVHNVQNEFIEEIFLEMEIAEDGDRRKASGLLLAFNRVVAPDATKRIWGEPGFRVFLSHKSEVKQETAELKERLRVFGISSFVAHQDIHPTKAWQDEVENALASMDGFVALMTKDFHDSEWTDQEVGFALARGTPIVAVQMGKEPYGFIGKFQALSSSWQSAAEDIVKVLIQRDRMFEAYLQALRQCSSWDCGNTQAKVFPGIAKLTVQQIDEFVSAYNQTEELHGSFGFNGSRPQFHGPGLASYLNRLSQRKFRFASSGEIEPVT